MKFGKIELDHDGFDWDEFKSGKVKDRMPLETVEELFKRKFFSRKDERHSLSEERFIAMGEVKSRILFVSYTIRKKGTETLIRVISSRFVHSNSKEERIYEKAKEFIEKNRA